MAIVMLVVGLLPACRLKNALLNLTGRARVAPSARIQPSLFWHVRLLVLGERAYIGPGNAFRELLRVELGDDAEVGQLNWVSAAGGHLDASNALKGCLVLAPHAVVISRHYVDCSGGVSLGRLSILGGVRSTVLSHSVDSRRWEISARPVVIGERCLLLSHVLVNAGTTVADGVVVAGGAVVARDLTESGRLYGGVPAKVIGDVTDSEVVRRDASRVVPREEARERQRGLR